MPPETGWVDVLSEEVNDQRGGHFPILIQKQYFLPLILSNPEVEGRVLVRKSKHVEARSLTQGPK